MNIHISLYIYTYGIWITYGSCMILPLESVAFINKPYPGRFWSPDCKSGPLTPPACPPSHQRAWRHAASSGLSEVFIVPKRGDTDRASNNPSSHAVCDC